MKFKRRDLLIHTNFLTKCSKNLLSISLFYCCNKVLTYMNSWMIEKNLMKHHYQIKKIFTVTYLNVEDITNPDYEHGKRVRKDFEIKYFGQYHLLYVHSDTLLLTNLSENLRNISLEIYELVPVCFLTAPGLVWQAALKMVKVKLNGLTDIDMLLMAKKGIRREICHIIY